MIRLGMTSHTLDDWQHALKALENRKCCLFAHHGVIATGASLGKALWLAGEVETLAKQYLLILSTGREAKLLSGDEIERVRLKNIGLWFENRETQKTGKIKQGVDWSKFIQKI